MKPIVEMTQSEIQHRIKWFDFYQVTSYVLFVMLIYISFLWLMSGDKVRVLQYEKECEKKAYLDHAKGEKAKMDSINMLRECGVR